MTTMTKPTDAASAIAFLHELAGAGLMFHPEDHAHHCLAHHRLSAATLDTIEANMRATFEHLPDPCEIALSMLGDPDPIITIHVSPYVSWQGPASEAHKARAVLMERARYHEDHPITGARAALDAHQKALRLEEGNGTETDLWHLFVSLLAFCEAEGINLDATLNEAREHHATARDRHRD